MIFFSFNFFFHFCLVLFFFFVVFFFPFFLLLVYSHDVCNRRGRHKSVIKKSIFAPLLPFFFNIRRIEEQAKRYKMEKEKKEKNKTKQKRNEKRKQKRRELFEEKSNKKIVFHFRLFFPTFVLFLFFV